MGELGHQIGNELGSHLVVRGQLRTVHAILPVDGNDFGALHRRLRREGIDQDACVIHHLHAQGDLAARGPLLDHEIARKIVESSDSQPLEA